MALTDCKQDQWLLDNAADMHVCNQREIFLSYTRNLSAMTGITLSSIFLGQEILKLYLSHKDGLAGTIFTL